jgi:hypothetical protein
MCCTLHVVLLENKLDHCTSCSPFEDSIKTVQLITRSKTKLKWQEVNLLRKEGIESQINLVPFVSLLLLLHVLQLL